MRVQNVILSTAIDSSHDHNFLDIVLSQLKSMGLTPTIVLSNDGDDYLRTSRLIHSYDLVYDPNAESNLLSGLKAGLAAINAHTFYLPLGYVSKLGNTNENVWQTLDQYYSTLPPFGPEHILRPKFDGEDGFPLLVTLSGVRELNKNKNSSLENLHFVPIEVAMVSPTST